MIVVFFTLLYNNFFQPGVILKLSSTINLLEYYELSDEENRLRKDKAHRVEFITTTYFIDNLIKRKHRPIKILDLGAGTGKYTYYYAKNGHSVTQLI